METLLHEEDNVIMYDDLDDAIIGVSRRFGRGPIIAYDVQKCLAIYMKQGMTYEEAVEYFDFNVIGMWVGDGTPEFIEVPDSGE